MRILHLASRLTFILGIDDAALLDDGLAVELDRAVAHRHIVVPARVPLAPALRIGAGRKEEISRKGARRGAVPLGRVAMQRDAVPQRLRIHAPAEVRYRERVAVAGRRFPVLEPVAHQLRVHAAIDARDVAFADLQLDRIGDVAAVRQDDDVAGLEDDGAVRAAFVRKGMDVPAAPVVEMPALVRIAPLRHHRVFAAFVREVRASLAFYIYFSSFFVNRFGVLACVLQTLRRHQLLEVVGRIDDHQHARAAVGHLLQPFREQRHMEDHHQVGGGDRLEGALALADGRHADLGPRRQRVHAQLVDVGAKIVGGGKRGLDVLAARRQVADYGDGLALLHAAQLELLAGTAEPASPG